MILQSHIKNLEKLNSENILSQIQANIFKPHGRTFVWCLFMAFEDMAINDEDEVEINNWKQINRSAIKNFAIKSDIKITSGEQQQEDANEYRLSQTNGGIVTCLFLSRRGMEKMGVPPKYAKVSEDSEELIKNEEPFIPNDSSFWQGMTDDQVLGRSMDDLGIWESKYYHKSSDPVEQFFETREATKLRNNPIDFMILLADNDEDDLTDRETQIKNYFKEACNAKILFTERGKKKVNAKGEAIEPFGFRDGVSMTPFWSKGRKLLKKNRQIVLDEQMGSYFVFRKLEQNVKAFDKKVNNITRQLFFKDPTSGELLPDEEILNDIHNFWEKRQLVEAQLMGRFKDGTPVTMFDKPILNNALATPDELSRIDNFNVYNSFDFRDNNNAYNEDAEGSKCPFHTHIRKANPRDETVITPPTGYSQPTADSDQLPQVEDDETTVPIEIRMIRRGIPYEDNSEPENPKEGLLFMSYHVSILFQYEVIHNLWCLDSPVAYRYRKIDAMVDNNEKESDYTFPKEWGVSGNEEVIQMDFEEIVTPRGGEYLYSPSITWLEKL